MDKSARCTAANQFITVSMMLMMPGPMMMMNSVGRMKIIIGTVIIAGSLAPFSSAFIMRSLRNSADSTRSDWASGVPNFSVWRKALTRARTPGMSLRLARF
jgi:hypothetical protein